MTDAQINKVIAEYLDPAPEWPEGPAGQDAVGMTCRSMCSYHDRLSRSRLWVYAGREDGTSGGVATHYHESWDCAGAMIQAARDNGYRFDLFMERGYTVVRVIDINGKLLGKSEAYFPPLAFRNALAIAMDVVEDR
jgi:hypothetical protein